MNPKEVEKLNEKVKEETEKKQEMVVKQKEQTVADIVMAKIAEYEGQGMMSVPPNYSYPNAIKSAWLLLQEVKDRDGNYALQVCTPNSIANALFDMVIQGLSPMKKQCYFIVYGTQLSCFRSYFGTVAVVERVKGVKRVFAEVIYEGDEFAYQINLDTATKEIVKHEQSIDNIDGAKIRGAYAIVLLENGDKYVEIMTIDQIKMSWSMKKTKSSMPQEQFSDQMAKRTVLNRACKLILNTSDDSDLLIGAINKTDEDEIDQSMVIENVIPDANSTLFKIDPPQRDEKDARKYSEMPKVEATKPEPPKMQAAKIETPKIETPDISDRERQIEMEADEIFNK